MNCHASHCAIYHSRPLCPGAYPTAWGTANAALLAKTISELHFEQALFPKPIRTGCYGLNSSSGIHYEFKARPNIWGHLVVNPGSVVRIEDQTIDPEPEAALFFIDFAEELEINPLVLGTFLEEVANTLMADRLILGGSEHLDAAAFVDLDSDQQQNLLSGHPKALPSKGRMGWGLEDYRRYAPESRQSFQLQWIAARKELLLSGFGDGWDEAALLRQSLDSEALFQINRRRRVLGAEADHYQLIPMHPWQWDQKICSQFQGDLARRDLIPLGAFGDRYMPLISLRTMTNLDRPTCFNIKLPLSILNTSCRRGLPGKFIQIAPALSAWLSSCCTRDPLLRDKGVVVLEEPAGVHYRHPLYSRFSGAAYHYHEMLGAVWRESVHAHLAANEKAVLAAVFLQRDRAGTPLVTEYIRRSGLDAAAWVHAWFEEIVVPLYHLMCRFGVGLVAHGQNVTVILQNFRPVRLALKDFQGDLRLVDRNFPEMADLPPEVAQTVTRLPPHYLVHDLQTGHFVTVLRFLSNILAESGLLKEDTFYALLADALSAYMRRHPHLAPRFQLFDLLEPSMRRVCINRVRFREGYEDRHQRPLPILGSDLPNPLVHASTHTTLEVS